MRVDYQRHTLSKTIKDGSRRFAAALRPKLDRKIRGSKVVGVLSLINVARDPDTPFAFRPVDFTCKGLPVRFLVGSTDKNQKAVLAFFEGRGKPRSQDRVTELEGCDPTKAAN